MNRPTAMPLRIDQQFGLNGADTEPGELRALLLDLRHDRKTLDKEDTSTVANLLEDAFDRITVLAEELKAVKDQYDEVKFRMDSLEK